MSAAGYDFGNSCSYVALVRTGGIETVDNELSYRATPTYVSFTNSLRLTGNPASAQALLNVGNTFFSFKNLIGLDFDDPIAGFEMQHTPLNFIKLEDGKVGVLTNYLNKQVTFSVLQLVTMIISDLKKTTLMHAPAVPSCVFSVPNYFTFNQRRAFIAAIEAADVFPSGLINDTMAVCLNYALFKTDLPKPEEPPRNVVFVDVGHSSTQVCVASFNSGTVKILSSVGTNQVGGRMFDKLLCEKFCHDFYNKNGLSVKDNHKAYLKLLSESEKVKRKTNATSANVSVRVECLMQDIDFSSSICRDEFDALSEQIYIQFRNILLSALEASRLKPEEIFAVETVGGSSRIFGFKKIISEVFGKDVSTTLNMDEAVARGCAVMSALMSPTVRIRQIEVTETMTLDFDILYLNKSGDQKHLKVCNKGSSIPTKKELVFPPNDNFSFVVNQTDICGSVHQLGVCKILKEDSVKGTPDKLVFLCDIDISSIFSVVKAYYKFPKAEDSNEQNSDNNKVKKVGNNAMEQQSVKFEFQIFQDYKKLIPHVREVEKEILANIVKEKEISNAKNALEEFIYSSRDKCDSQYKPFISTEELSQYLDMLAAKENWLYDQGEYQPVNVYQNQLKELMDAFLPFQARHNRFSECVDGIENLFQMLTHYKKFIDVYKQDPSKYYITQEDYEQYCQKISQVESYAFSADNQIKTHPKIKLLPILPQEIKQNTAELKSCCDKIIKKANTAPPPVPDPTPSTVESQPMSTDQAENPIVEEPKIDEKEKTCNGTDVPCDIDII